MRLKITFSLIAATLLSWSGHAQNPLPDTLYVHENIPEGYELVDSVVYIPASVVDTALVGKLIFSELPLVSKGGNANVKVHQSKAIWDSMHEHFNTNKDRTITGYRVRIFFDNKRTARTESENTLNRFVEKHRDIAAYRSYVNPYFKVTVGNFRTKSEAMQLLSSIKREFPSAFIVKENISYPVVDKERPVIVDTIKILRPIQTVEQ